MSLSKEEEYKKLKEALETFSEKELMIAQVMYLKDIKDRLDDIKDSIESGTYRTVIAIENI